MSKAIGGIAGVAIAAILAAQSARAQDVSPGLTLNGTPGLIEMPGGQPQPEGTLSATVGYGGGLTRATLSFQPHPRVGASLRITNGEVWNDTATGTVEGETHRSLDLRLLLAEEGARRPAITLGLQDLLSPAPLGGEYIVATKGLGERLSVSAGLGWGVFGQRDGFTSPLGADWEVRPESDTTEPGGTLARDQWFRGDMAVFGGIEWQVNDRWSVAAEYSSTTYPASPGAPVIEVDAPVNLGVTWRPRPGAEVELAYLYGNTIGLAGSFTLDANDRPGQGGREAAPAPIRPRLAAAPGPLPESALSTALGTLLEMEGIRLTALDVAGDRAVVQYVNGRYRSQAQAMGRVARMMTQVMPQEITRFTLQPEAMGVPLSAVTIRRDDLDRLDTRPGATEALLAATAFDDATTRGLTRRAAEEPAFAWGLAPYGRLLPETAEGNGGLDIGLELTGRYQIAPSLVLAGTIGQSLLRTDAEDPPADPTPDLQNVRSDAAYYGDDGHPVLRDLTLTHYSRPGANLYGRVAAGYLEPMFAGVVGEVLWKPVDSRLGLGLELAHVAQRDSDMLLGIDDYDYRTTTGHLSAYYDLGQGYHTQVDLGRYLAGDWGATLHLDREFANGVRVGGYVTRTEATDEDFGAGSYAKGVRVTIPRDFLFGTPSRGTYGSTFDLASGDGGARLEVDGRLYEVVRDAHRADLALGWGRFWR